MENTPSDKIAHTSTALKNRVFLILTFLVPVLFFGVIEGVLRIGGYGDDYPLFEPVPGFPDYLRPTEDVARRYFATIQNVPGIPFDSFKAQKDSSGFRIFVQGGSTAAGFPFYFGGAFPDMLEQRLWQTFPGKTIEVVNTAMAAVNSYTLSDFVDEIIEQEPDLVLIYAGHNEYYGALGVGSSESFGRSPHIVRLYLRLQNLRLVQALRTLLGRAAATLAGAPSGEPPEGTLMERMVGEQRIPYSSDLYHAGLEQFRYNLAWMLQRYRDAGIPVMIGTVVSNERDHAPFISGLGAGTDAAAWTRQSRTVDAALAVGDTVNAMRALHELIRADTLAAEPYYRLARLEDGLGRYGPAREHYVAAKDRDELRFRAPTDINRIIRELAADHGATVVETEQALAKASEGGIPGANVMTEHLHPNVTGYFLLSDAFYGAIRDGGLIGDWTRAVPTYRAREELLVTRLDSLVGAYRVQALMSSWPFQPIGQPAAPLDTLAGDSIEGQLALQVYRREIRRVDALDRLQQVFTAQGRLGDALQAQFSIIQRYPFLPEPYLAAANVLVRQGRYEDSMEYCLASLERGDSAEGRRLLGSLLLQNGNTEEAIRQLEHSLELEPNNLQAMYNLAGAFALTRDYDSARAMGARILESYPNHVDTRRLLGSLPPAGGAPR